jgi:DNA-binding response OmpR family regulator
MANILIAEDERAINDLIKLNLTLVGHKCEQVFDGAAALERALSGEHDLILLDVMLPELSGFEIIGQIKTPVIFVTARVSVEDRLRGLKLGADDYIVKPFEILELVERVKAVLRRTKGESEAFEFDGIRVEFDTRRVYKDGAEIILKPKEFELLSAFITNRNLALSREKLLSEVWGYDFYGDARTLDTHVKLLRKSLGVYSKYIVTLRGVGYRFEGEE